MKDAYDSIIKDRATIIHDLVKIYSTIGSDSKIKEDISKIKVMINELLKKKDKLLDLNIKGHVSDDEFAKRNRQFNLEIESLEVKITNLEEEEEKNKHISLTVETLRKLIADELDFKEGFDNTIVDALLDHIEVYKTEEKNVIKLKVFFKVISDEKQYKIRRSTNASFTLKEKGGDTSVCSEAYVLSVANRSIEFLRGQDALSRTHIQIYNIEIIIKVL